MSYKLAKERVNQGHKDSGDSFVPSLMTIETKSKWDVPPVNTKGHRIYHFPFLIFFPFSIFHFSFFTFSIVLNVGAEIKPHTLCCAKYIYSTIRCKSCGKPRPVFLVGNTKMSLNDKEKVNNFLENQSLNYSCGVDVFGPCSVTQTVE